MKVSDESVDISALIVSFSSFVACVLPVVDNGFAAFLGLALAMSLASLILVGDICFNDRYSDGRQPWAASVSTAIVCSFAVYIAVTDAGTRVSAGWIGIWALIMIPLASSLPFLCRSGDLFLYPTIFGALLFGLWVAHLLDNPEAGRGIAISGFVLFALTSVGCWYAYERHMELKFSDRDLSAEPGKPLSAATKLWAFVSILISVADLGTDIAYIAVADPFPQLVPWLIAFLAIPFLGFFPIVLKIGLPESPQWLLQLIGLAIKYPNWVWQARTYQPGVFDMLDNIFKCLIYAIVLFLVLFWQFIGWFIVLVIGEAVAIGVILASFGLVMVYYTVVLAFTWILLYPSKALAVGHVYRTFARIWAGADCPEARVPGQILGRNYYLLLLVEAFAESIPQLVLQSINNTVRGNWSDFTITSAALSGFIVINTLYRVGYFKLYHKIPLASIPIYGGLTREEIQDLAD